MKLISRKNGISNINIIICGYFLKAGDTNPGDPQGDPDTSQVMDDELDILNEDSNYNSKLHPRFNEDTLDRSLLISLDQAILRSIESCSSDEVKKKMYSSIVLVGGGIRFNNINKFLTQKLALQVPMYLFIIRGHTQTMWTGIRKGGT